MATCFRAMIGSLLVDSAGDPLALIIGGGVVELPARGRMRYLGEADVVAGVLAGDLIVGVAWLGWPGQGLPGLGAARRGCNTLGWRLRGPNRTSVSGQPLIAWSRAPSISSQSDLGSDPLRNSIVSRGRFRSRPA